MRCRSPAVMRYRVQAPSRSTYTAVPSATTGAPAARCNKFAHPTGLVGVLANAKLGEHVGRVLVAYFVPFVLGHCSLVPRGGGVDVDLAHHGAMSVAFAGARIQEVPFGRDLARTERWPAAQSRRGPRSDPLEDGLGD
jgi:hypothetical protein